MASLNLLVIKKSVLYGVALAFFITALVFLIYMSIYTSKPGPHVYENPFIAILLSSSLIFITAQLSILAFFNQTPQKWAKILTIVYWVTAIICGLIIFVGYIVPKNPKCAGLGFLIFLAGVVGFLARWLLIRRPTHLPIDSPPCQAPPAETRRSWKRVVAWLNRTIKSVHWIFLILTATGAIVVACQERYPNPGTRIRITLPSGHTPAISYNCTHPANTNTTAPTIWFESTPAHGVLDFLGVQHHLATAHNLSSCSYDPPNYGWSDALPATTLANDTDYLPALLRALGPQERGQRRVLVGWGGGLELAVRHAVADPGATAAVVDVEGGPDGIEWLDAQRVHGWTEGQRLEYRKADIDSRISLTELILSIGLGFGLTPLVIPANRTQYFSPDLYPAYRAQSLRNPFWAMQYYSLQQMAAQPRESSYLATTVLPAGIKAFALLTRDVYPDDAAASEFYRVQKLGMADRKSVV